jgi:hypothetical protein
MKGMLRVVLGTIVVAGLMSPVLEGGAAAHTTREVARMNGDKVVGSQGDPNAFGRAEISTASEINTICYKIYFHGIPRAISAHIHHGGRTAVGEKELKLFYSERGKGRSPVEGCKHDVPVTTIEHIESSPHYVDVHTNGYPKGAMRGQLKIVAEE